LFEDFREVENMTRILGPKVVTTRCLVGHHYLRVFLQKVFSNSEGFYQYLKDSFDQVYADRGENPKMMNVGLHVRKSGRAGEDGLRGQVSQGREGEA
jgi:hypothetical protein